MADNDIMKGPENTGKNQKLFTARQIRYAVFTALVLLCLLGIAAVFVLRVYFMTENACYDDLAVETEDAITDLEANLRSDRMMLRVIAGYIGNSEDVDSIEVGGYLTNYDFNNLITQVGILLPDDAVMLSRGYNNSLNGVISFETESKLGEHISGSIMPGTNTRVVRNYVPIRRGGICEGMLFSTANSSNIAKAWLPNVYDKKGECYVVDRRSGEIIINTTSDGLENINDIPFRQTNNDYTKDVAVSDILEGRKGYSVFRSEAANEDLYMCYLPFIIEDWEMVVFVPESAVFSAVEPVRSGMYKLVAATIIIILIYFIWLVREIRASISEAEHKANIDVLTGLPNRNRFEAYLKKLENSKDRVICLYIDANGLHELNNTKGHYAGDQMLRFIADSLKVEFGGEHIYRIGGDEFIVFLPDNAENTVDEALKNFIEALQRNDYHAAVGKCISNKGMSVEEIIKNAEKEMYEAKQKYYEKIGKVMRI